MNTNELITALKIRGSFPSSNELFSDSDYLVLFNHVMQTEIVPTMLLLSEDYFVLTKNFSVVQNQSYRLPSRAIAAKLRDLYLEDSGGNVTPLSRLFSEDIPANPSGYYLERNSVTLSNQFTTGTLIMKYFSRPNKLVLPSACAQIESIDIPNSQVTVTTLPNTFTTNSVVDFVQNQNPYDWVSHDITVSGISGLTVTLSEVPSTLEVGDWLCIAQQSPVPQVPEEMHPIVVQAALVYALSSKKDKAAEYEAKVLERLKQDAIRMMDPRVENNSVSFRSGRLLNFFSDRWY
jgi:hypothetical protein